MPNVQTHPHHQNSGNRQKFQCDLRPLNVAVLFMFTCCFLNEDVTNKLVSEWDFTICQPGFFAVSLPYIVEITSNQFLFLDLSCCTKLSTPQISHADIAIQLPDPPSVFHLCQEPGSNFAVSFLRFCCEPRFWFACEFTTVYPNGW